MRLRRALLTAAVLAFPAVAKAQPVAGPYISLGAGMNFLENEILRASGPAIEETRGGRVRRTLTAADERRLGVPGKITAHFLEPGLSSDAAIGWGLGNGLRLEVEGFYKYNHVHKLQGTAFPTAAGGENEEYGGMVNALYDFDIGMPFVFPYAGLGAGVQWTTWHNVHAYSAAVPIRADVNDTTTPKFAYQGIAGLAFPVAGFPGLSLTAEYRFLGTLENNSAFNAVIRTGTESISKPATSIIRTKLSLNNEYAHQVMFGLRYAFGVAVPPPPPPPPVVTPVPAPARTYLVFFDWDRADLTARARQIIAEAAEASRHVAYTRIEVNGYTDRSGTPQYNIRLSIRRANNVAAELVRDGVPRNVIDIHGFGETHPLVPTAPGVREPQNRRVEIILR